ncbi:MAG: phosphoribosyl transferase [Gammaproteobacteria bacterium]|nr:MAG: phosphoribosyl transferase [Gammaproteobacteria bacterium]
MTTIQDQSKKGRYLVLSEHAFRLKNRAEAGRLLAQGLKEFNLDHPVICAVPRGGLPVAVPIACELNAALDMVLIKKLGAPGNPEFAIGTVDEDGRVYLKDYASKISDEDYIQGVAQLKWQELQQEYKPLRERIPAQKLEGRDVVIVDDGVATGSSFMSAVMVVRNYNPKRIIAAIPVSPAETFRAISSMVDAAVAVMVPEEFAGGVGFYYQNFEQVQPEEIDALINQYQKCHDKAT